MTKKDWIKTMIERIVDGFHPTKIILFGSSARDVTREDSDVDLLVVLPKVENRRQSAVAIRRVLRDIPVSKDIIVTTPEEIEQRGQIIGTLLQPALTEGKLLYEQSSAPH